MSDGDAEMRTSLAPHLGRTVDVDELRASGDKAVAERVHRAFGGVTTLRRYHHSTGVSFVDVMSCRDRPGKGITSFATVRLSEHRIYRDRRDCGTRFELAAGCHSDTGDMASALAAAAHAILLRQGFCMPGVLLRGVVAGYLPFPFEHLLFASPWKWDQLMEPLELRGRHVSWVWAIPVSTSELELARASNGLGSLLDRFDRENVDLFDLGRSPVA
ncbi:MAG: suppressor of fused domain protein [Polyangiaceae bacterium]|nr:suppressor of fused domain protein [Polyangiaceae bacterium]